MEKQITIDELMRKPEKVEIPEPAIGEKVFTIPADVWANRCQLCVHKRGKENIPVTLYMLEKQWFHDVIPCEIMRLNDNMYEMPGECMNFEPGARCYGICGSCEHNNSFVEGFCMKEDHKPQRRVYYGADYGGDTKKKDYYSRHRFCVCDDYEPDEFARGAVK